MEGDTGLAPDGAAVSVAQKAEMAEKGNVGGVATRGRVVMAG